MPISLYDPHTQTKQPLSPEREVVIACGELVGGSARLASLRRAVHDDVLRRRRSSPKEQRDTTLECELAELAGGELEGECEPETLRHWCLTVHHRAPLTLTRSTEPGVCYPQLDDSERRLSYLYAAHRRLLELPAERVTPVQSAPGDSLARLPDALGQAIDDDLDTPLALVEVQAFAIAVNALCDAALRKRGRVNASAVAAARSGFAAIYGLLGIGGEQPVAFLERVRDRRARRLRLDVKLIEEKLAQRSAARAAKDFAGADQLQAELFALGVNLLDGPQGTSWTLS